MAVTASTSAIITKEEFLAACDKFKPNGWMKFYYKYFSKSTKIDDMWLKKWFRIILLVSFFAAFIGTILKLGKIAIGIPTMLLGAMLIFVVFGGFIAAFMNGVMIRKIRKELGGISKIDYDKLYEKYSE